MRDTLLSSVEKEGMEYNNLSDNLQTSFFNHLYIHILLMLCTPNFNHFNRILLLHL